MRSKLLFLPAAVLLAATGHAANLEVAWTHPTQYEDNTPIPSGVLAATELQYGICNATKNGLLASPAPVVVSVAQPAATGIISGLGAGTWCVQARSTQVSGLPSAWTAFVWKDIVLVPKPPTGLTVVATVAYTVIKRVDRFVMLPVGTVPADTQCDSAQSVNGYYVVPRSKVTWTGSVQPDVVVAQCG